jgi:hypothetical protein
MKNGKNANGILSACQIKKEKTRSAVVKIKNSVYCNSIPIKNIRRLQN